MAAVMERVIAGRGTSETEWNSWSSLATFPPLDVSSRSQPGARLVVVAPHPDDEVLACGGLIQLHERRGGTVLVVAVTDGEASHDHCAAVKRATLAATRRAESALGLRRLAANPIQSIRLGLPDGAVRDHSDALEQSLQGILRPTDLVVTAWRLDGHPDHDAVGESTAFICQGIGARLLEAPVWMWHWARPDDPRVPWRRLRELHLPSEAVDCKTHALAAHATQLSDRGRGEGPVLDESIQARARRRVEHYFV